MTYGVTIPYADRSDAYLDSFPNPDLVFFLTYTHSYLEKGLKYLCLISDPAASYSQVEHYRHDLQKSWRHLERIHVSASLEKILRDRSLWALFIALSSVSHPGLRYLHVEKTLTVDVRQLSNLVTCFKDFLLLRRRDVVYADPVVFAQLKALSTCIEASTPVSILPTGSQHIEWAEWTLNIKPQGA
jgi:hypothetical protein